MLNLLKGTESFQPNQKMNNLAWGAFYINSYKPVDHKVSWPSRLRLQNTLIASLQKGKIPAKSVLDMTLNNLMHLASVMLELWGMWSTPSLPSLPGTLCLRIVAPGRILSMGQI